MQRPAAGRGGPYSSAAAWPQPMSDTAITPIAPPRGFARGSVASVQTVRALCRNGSSHEAVFGRFGARGAGRAPPSPTPEARSGLPQRPQPPRHRAASAYSIPIGKLRAAVRGWMWGGVGVVRLRQTHGTGTLRGSYSMEITDHLALSALHTVHNLPYERQINLMLSKTNQQYLYIFIRHFLNLKNKLFAIFKFFNICGA